MTARRLLAALLAATVATIGLAAQPAAAATPAATVVVAPDDGGVIRSGQDLRVAVTVSNPGSTALAAGRITTSLDPAPAANTATLLTEIAHPPVYLQGKLTLASGRVPALDAGSSATVRLTVTSDDLSSILTSASGARLLYAQYQSGTVQTIAESSVVKISAGSDASVGFGTVIPILAPAGTTGVVEPTDQQRLAGPDGAWSSALRAALADPTATIALDPEVLASIRFAGTAAPPEAAGFLDQLGRLPNQFVELPYADGDVTLERAAGADSVLTASSFAGITLAPLTDGGPTPAPSATTASTSVDDLTKWNWSGQSVAWPVPHTTGSTDLSALTKAKDTVLLASDDVKDTPTRRAAGPLARVGSARVLVSDATASSLVAQAAAGGPTGDAALASLVGVLATAAVTGESAAVLTSVGRAGVTSGLDRVLSVLQRQSWIQGRSLEQFGSQSDPVRVELRPHAVASARVSTARSLLDGESAVRELGKAMTADADTVTAPRRLSLLGMLSAAWRADDDGWRTSATTVEKNFADVVGAVSLTQGSDSNAIGNDGTLQVTVVNELPVPVTVVIRPTVSNGRLQFKSSSAVTVRVPAQARNIGKLAFRSISNGNTDVSLRLTTPDGTTIGTTVVRRVNVTAGFDTIVAVVLLTALGLLLALGVYRNVTRRRQPRTAAA